MHLLDTFETPHAIHEGLARVAPAPLPAGIARVEVWGSSFTDPGPDFCEFRCFGADRQPVTTYRQNGY